MEVEYYWYIFSAILGAISIAWVIFSIVRGKGLPRIILVFFTSLLCVGATLCFGGNAVLSMFDMGWRCEPFNIMLFLCSLLVVPVSLFGILQLISLKDTNSVLIRCGILSISIALIVILISSFLYFQLTSWSDGLTVYDAQTIVYKTNGHGSFGSWHYYTHINDLIHGIEITQDGWHGTPPRSFF